MQTRSGDALRLDDLVEQCLLDADKVKGTVIPLARRVTPQVIHRFVDHTGRTVEDDFSSQPISDIASLVLTHVAQSSVFWHFHMRPIMERFFDDQTARWAIEWTESFREKELRQLGKSSLTDPPSFETLHSYLILFTPLIVLTDEAEEGIRGSVDKGNEITILLEAAQALNSFWRTDFEDLDDWPDEAHCAGPKMSRLRKALKNESELT